jgi:hypothetical protein
VKDPIITPEVWTMELDDVDRFITNLEEFFLKFDNLICALKEDTKTTKPEVEHDP